MHRPGRRADFLFGDGGIAQGDVALNISGKKEHVLLYLPDGPSQHVRVNIPDVHTVDQDFPLLNIIIASDQIQDGGFSCSCGSYKGRFLTGTDHEAHVLQNIILLCGLLFVGKPNMAKLDLPLNLYLHRLGRICDLGLFIQNGKDFLGGGKGGLEGAELLRQFLDRLKKAADVGDEDKQGSQREASL